MNESPQTPQARVDQLDPEIETIERKIDSTDTEIDELAQQIAGGSTDIGPEVIPDRRRLREHLQYVVDGLKAQREQAVVAARLVRLRQVRREIDAYVDDADGSFAELVTLAQESQADIIKAIEARRLRINEWRVRLREEKVPSYSGGDPEASPAHAGLFYGNDGLGAGTHRLPAVGAEGVLDLVRKNAEAIARDHRAGVRPISLIRTAAPLPDGLRYFVEPGGSVSYFAPDQVPADFLHSGSRQQEITHEEARHIWHSAGPDGQPVSSGQSAAVHQLVQVTT